MNRTLLVGLFLLGLSPVAWGQVKLQNLDDSASYAIGFNYAKQNLSPALKNIQAQGFKLNNELIAAAIRDVLLEKKTVMSDSLLQQVLVNYQTARLHEITFENLKKGQEFLAKNGKNPGVVTTASGLQYTILTPGTGSSPDANDVVTVRYKGSLINGFVFDETDSTNTVEFPVNGVIKGWTEALQLMNAGAKWRLFVPTNLAYGAKGAGESIGPNEVLIFDVELVSFEQK